MTTTDSLTRRYDGDDATAIGLLHVLFQHADTVLPCNGPIVVLPVEHWLLNAINEVLAEHENDEPDDPREDTDPLEDADPAEDDDPGGDEHDGREPGDCIGLLPLPTEEEAQAEADLTGNPVLARGYKVMEPRVLAAG